MSAVDDDEVPLAIEPRSPQRPCRPFELVTRQAARVHDSRIQRVPQPIRACDQRLSAALDPSLCYPDSQTYEARRFRRRVLDLLIDIGIDRSIALHDFPGTRKIVGDT